MQFSYMDDDSEDESDKDSEDEDMMRIDEIFVEGLKPGLWGEKVGVQVNDVLF